MNAYLILWCLAVVINSAFAECGSEVGKPSTESCPEGVIPCLKESYGRGVGRIPDKKPCGPGERDDGTSCWLDSYGRGAGRMPDKAPCPSGLRDDGTSCWKDAHIYGKGCCCTIWGCCGRCPSGYNDDGCTCRRTGVGIKLTLFDRQSCKSYEDKYGALCYPKCREGYSAVGCCICEPSGGARIVATLQQRYTCNSDEELYAALCYPKCKEGYSPFGCCVCQPEKVSCPEKSILLNGVCIDTSTCSTAEVTKLQANQTIDNTKTKADEVDEC